MSGDLHTRIAEIHAEGDLPAFIRAPYFWDLYDSKKVAFDDSLRSKPLASKRPRLCTIGRAPRCASVTTCGRLSV